MKITTNKWCNEFLKKAKEFASFSKDTSTKTGAIIVDDLGRIVSAGYNGIPRGVKDDIAERHQRPEKYYWFEHAERNAIYLARSSLDGCTMFVTHHPCSDCARGIVQAGITRVVIDNRNNIHGEGSMFHNNLSDTFRVAKIMFDEANVDVILYQDGQ